MTATPYSRRAALALALIMVGLAGLLTLHLSPPSSGAAEAGTVGPAAADPASFTSDERELQLLALERTYGEFIDSLITTPDDVVFAIGRQRIHFQDGKLLGPGHLEWAHRYDSIFYDYPLDPLTEPVPWAGERIRIASDFLDAIFGRNEAQRRTHGRSARFLEHSIFINTFCAEELAAIEAELLAAARTDPDLQTWIEELRTVYSFQTRSISNTGISSFHAYGLALDLEPRSYGRRQVFWEWTRVWYGRWDRLPLDQRWSPPQAVIEIFERHGFVWGGKWARFDTIHFEYRPEILLYNRLRAERDVPLYR